MTVWEILLALLVLAVVAAVLMPVYSSDGRGLPGTRCLSNLKQLALAEIMYSGDSDDRFTRSEGWMDSVRPYVKLEDVEHDFEGIEKGQYGYAFRERAGGEKAEQFRLPADTILVFDSNLVQRSAHSELWSIPQPGRHKSRDVCAFMDGHARMLGSPTVEHPELGSTLQLALQADDKATKNR